MRDTRTFRGFVWALAGAAALMFSGCSSSGVKAGAGRRVVMISYDGVGADLAWGWIDDGWLSEPDGIMAMVHHGMAARRVRMVDPTLTAVNHISLITGALPQVTGIVSNRFHLPGTPITASVSGFAAPIHAETLWQAARRQGKRVGVLTWPGADGTSAARRGDFGLIWPARPLAASRIVVLRPEQAGAGSPLPSNDGLPPLVWTVRVKLPGASPGKVSFRLISVDGTPNGIRNYDSVAVIPPGSGEPKLLGRDRWFAVKVEAQARSDQKPYPYGSWCRVLHLDRHTGAVRLYEGDFYRVIGYPAAFEDAIAGHVGFWPGPPNNRELSKWWLDMSQGIDLETYLQQLERLDRYLDRVAAYVIGHERFDLLLAYHPTPDEFEHAALLVDKRQWGWSPGSALAAHEGMKRVARSFDRSVASMAALLDPARDDLIIVSDHGHMPLFDFVKINQALANAGLLTVDTSHRHPRPSPKSLVVATTSGGCAHLYLNLKGRTPGGVVAPADAAAVLRRAAKALADIDADGQPVVDRIFTRVGAAKIGLDSPNSGDLIVFLKPGYAASSRLGGKVVVPSAEYGEHGYLNVYDPLCGICFARGAGIPHSHPKEIRATSIAPMVAKLLGIAPPGK